MAYYNKSQSAQNSFQTSPSQANGAEFLEGGVGQKADFIFILNRQLDRINFVATYPNKIDGADFTNAVDIFDIMLEPYKDNLFAEEEARWENQLNLILNKYEDIDREEVLERYTPAITKKRLRALMRLMSRKGFIESSRISAMDTGIIA